MRAGRGAFASQDNGLDVDSVESEMTSWDTLLQVIIGGVIGLLVGLIGPPLSHLLNAGTDRRKKRAEKLEELFGIIYAHRQWIESLEQIRMFGKPDTQPIDPLPRTIAISSVYFHQFDGPLLKLESTGMEYLLWTRQAQIQRLEGKSWELNEGFTEAYNPYLTQFEEVINALRILLLNRSIPDDHMDPRRSAFFMARSVQRDIRDGVRTC